MVKVPLDTDQQAALRAAFLFGGETRVREEVSRIVGSDTPHFRVIVARGEVRLDVGPEGVLES